MKKTEALPVWQKTMEQETEMYCSACGSKLVDGARFCSKCGAPNKALSAGSGLQGGPAAPAGPMQAGTGQPAVKMTPPPYSSAAVGNAPAAGVAPPQYGTPPAVPPRKVTYFTAAKAVFLRSGIKGWILLAALVILLVLGMRSLIGRHDLSGTYTYNGAFPITTITFSKDGTFTARCDYYEYDTGAIYRGKYRKRGRTYKIEFTGADTSSGNAVVNLLDETYGYSFKLSARKRGDNALDIWVSGGNSYYAWMNTTATFYRY